MVLSPAALDFRTIWPGLLLQAAREGDEMAKVGVPCQSLSPPGTTRSGGSLKRVMDVDGDRSMTRVSWWTRILEMVYCLGRKVWLRRR